ncbi:hypothetical protein HJG60_004068 [Phyllostomus discolor]|uniref:Uncharacterized protein n=1 Tax=Phyllostomus discolor TaxID=89673 RepID=A0A834A9U3_9CHIR|nr:hypothetical protein HJG60_004068 [Phyllostomus discolor]
MRTMSKQKDTPPLQVSKGMRKLKFLEFSNLIKVVVYGMHKLQTKWMFRSMAERHCLRQERGMLRLEEAMNAFKLDPSMK